MRTYLLGDNDVRRYARDLIGRFAAAGLVDHDVTWIALGNSGVKIVDLLAQIVSEQGLPQPTAAILMYDRTADRLVWSDGEREIEDPGIDWSKPAVLIDSSIHSGRSMRRAVELLVQLHGACEVATYSLMMKRTSEFVPTYFGLIANEHDRVFFQLDEIPNHRLGSNRPFGALRLLKDEDVHRAEFVKTETESINKMSYGDLRYSSETQGFLVYVYEVSGVIAGVVSFKARDDQYLFVDLVARDIEFRDAKVGGMLMRWAETYARSMSCYGIELRAVESQLGFYRHFGFETIPQNPLDLGGEKYFLMRRKLLYNIKPQQQVTLDYLRS